MILRNSYLNSIRPFIGKPLIKAITGVRRCGKSTLLQQIMNRLKKEGIKAANLIYMAKF
ncbi:MAG: ATP-binding protein [Bacteroidia bacterium]|nr:ATP-binding protein [Bacteroidia bacterium]